MKQGEKTELSKQEEKVLTLAISGLGDRKVADEMGLSLETVRTYWKRIRRKIGVRSRHEAIAHTVRKGVEAEFFASLQKLEYQQKLYRDIFDTIAEGLLLADREGKCIEANPAMCRLVGFTREEIVGSPIQELAPDKEHTALGSTWADQIFREPWTGNVSLRHHDGRTINVEWSCAPHLTGEWIVAVMRAL